MLYNKSNAQNAQRNPTFNMSAWDPPAPLYVRETHAPERAAGNNEHAGGMRGKDNINPMVWTGRRRVIQHHHHQALPPAGATVP